MPLLFFGFILAGVLSSEQAPQAVTGAARLSGRVVEDGTNAPLSGARITVLPLDRAPGVSFPIGPPPQAITDQDGRYEFDGLPPGRYRIDAQKAGFASPLPSDPSVFRTIQLAAGQTLDGVNISLQKSAVITGQILDPATGEPLVGAMVMAMRRPDAIGAPAGVLPPGIPRLMPAGPERPDQRPRRVPHFRLCRRASTSSPRVTRRIPVSRRISRPPLLEAPS